jgi:hypothetical protein
MTTKTGEQNTLTSAEALKKIDRSKYPKLYERTEKLAKAEEVAENYKIRASKAEAKLKQAEPKAGGEDTPKQSSDLSTEDLYALVEAKVPQEDISEVKEYARFKKISIGEALKSSIVRTTLEENAEKRKTAGATNTGTARRGTSKVSGEYLLKRAEEKGELPESDADMDRLIEARLKRNAGSK